jgi:predicted DNA-binding transcriptional regulator
MKDLHQTLTEIGLTDGECQVYEALIELGQSRAGKIIKKANIASSKVYDVLFRLQNKGLASHTIKNGVRYFDATPPERLIDFLEDKKNSITEAQQKIEKIIPVLKAKQDAKEERNNVVVYTGPKGPKIVLKETIDAGKRGEKLMGFGSDEDPYKDYLPADIAEHFRDQKKYNIKWYLLFTKGKWSSPNPLGEVRYLPKGLEVPVRTMIYGDKVAIVDFHKPFTTIIIEKKEIADNYKKQFNLLWKIAKK